jgi:hypothetical protein
MNLPRFTLRDMFLATTLIAIGVGSATVAVRHQHYPYDEDAFRLIFFFSAASVGAGVFAPFHRKRQGAIFGAFFAAAAFIVEFVSEYLLRFRS